MTVLEMLALDQVSLQVKHALNPLQFAYPPLVGVDDAVIDLLQCAHPLNVSNTREMVGDIWRKKT